MPHTFQQSLLTFIIFLAVCFSTFIFISPYSFTSFIGPAAGITSALVIFYGARVLAATVLAALVYCLFLYFWVELIIEPSLVIISLLTFALQSFWAKQLTYPEVNRQKWLTSRRYLLSFLFKVGPISSFIVAFSGVALTVLENKNYGDNLIFTFVSCWSGSVLFSVFFAPLLLLYQGKDQLKSSKRFFILVASLLAIIAIALLFSISQTVQQYQRQDSFEQVKHRILQEIQQEVENTTDKLISLSALFKVNHQVSRSNFDLYSEQILPKKSSIRVLEWAPLVNHDSRPVFEKNVRIINEKDLQGIIQTASVRSHYTPIKYAYPSLNNEQVIGLDILTNSRNIIDMAKVIARKTIATSAPISLLQDQYANLGVLFVSPVFSEPTNINYSDTVNTQKQNIADNFLGFVVAVVQLDRFFQHMSFLNSENIALLIEDVTSSEPYVIFGKQLDNTFRYVDTSTIEVSSRKWRVSVAEKQPWQLQDRDWQVWGMLFGATIGGVIFQMLILMMAVYSIELSSQVVNKTRELIIAKEQSDSQNTAKTNFLFTLTRELQVPLQAIAHFTKQLYQFDIKEQNKIIKNIELAQQNINKLLDMTVDLSKIELGELTVNNEPFDFHGFISRVDTMLKATMSHQEKSITFLITPKVPHFINSDERRIQQLLMAFCDGVHDLFKVDDIRASIKIHNHNANSATLFFVFTNHDVQVVGMKTPFDEFILKGLALYSTEMAIAKEVCQFMNGDANLAVSASGERILTASIKIEITSKEQQQMYQAQTFDENVINGRKINNSLEL